MPILDSSSIATPPVEPAAKVAAPAPVPEASPPAPGMAFLPTLRVGDFVAEYWLRQVVVRLRRELCWLAYERGAATDTGQLPPARERLVEVLDFARYADRKEMFFATDETAAYLSALLAARPLETSFPPAAGTFGWVVQRLVLDDVAAFVLALALLPVIDPAAATVCAAVMNDTGRTAPTLALAQRLWDRPEELLLLADPHHALWRSGLLVRPPGAEALDWNATLTVPPVLAPTLLFPGSALPGIVRPIAAAPGIALPPHADLALARLRAGGGGAARIQPLIAPAGAALAETSALLAEAGGGSLWVVPGTAVNGLAAICSLAWLRGSDVYIDFSSVRLGVDERLAPIPAVPVNVFVGLHDRSALDRLQAWGALPAITLAPLRYAERRVLWRQVLGSALSAELVPAIDECARRFRLEHSAVLAAGRSLVALGRPLTAADVVAACRAESNIEIGDLAQLVEPRYTEAELMLPPKQSRQVREIITGMRALTEVHYGWDAARSWNECGLSALFAGPPGTGKTMAAEVIAAELGLPLYRIDLSQVVNKYIGETEKNLRRVFDAADASDAVLFFDEADAIFGRRTEVKDAHDRYANLEVSYLLARMERFKGLAILATNRKKDLDEAFLRRLRVIVDFPLPGNDERLRIWRGLLPPNVDCSQLDLPLLAQKIPLAGGHLRSIVFNACLQSARRGTARVLTMPAVLAAAKREYEKLERPFTRDQLGAHAAAIEALDRPSPS